MDDKKNGSLVKLDSRPYTVIAQENWGLTDEQMNGMHVHHRIPVAQGGTNDPANLFVCSPSFHAWVWHEGRFALISDASEVARLGGLAGGRKGGLTSKERGHGIFAPGQQSKGGKKGGPGGVRTQKERKIGLFALTSEGRAQNTRRQWKENMEFQVKMLEWGETLGRRMVDEARGAFAPENLGKGARTTNTTLWVDPLHPELGAHHFNRLSRLQREKGLPCGRNNRVKFTEEETQ